MSDDSDPKIVDRLKNQPPFAEEEVKEIPQEDINAETEVPQEDIKDEEQIVESKEEVKPEEEKQELKSRTTEQFDKLTEVNKELKKEVVKRQNILDSLIPPVIPTPEAPQWPAAPTTNTPPTQQQFPQLSQKQIDETFKGLVDENGYVDTGLLVSTLNELKEQNRIAQERATKAEQQAQTQGRQFDDFQRNAIMREVHAKYPTLDPENENFDEKLWKYVRNEVVDQWMTGKQTNVMAAAEEGMSVIHGNEMKKAEKEKIEQIETAKKNINALGSNQVPQREPTVDENLIMDVRKGKKGALAELLRKTGH